MNVSLKTSLFLFLCYLPILIVAQTETGFVYLKSGKTLQGQVFTPSDKDDEHFYFLAEEENSDTILLNPSIVDRFAIVTSNGKGRKNSVFITHPTDKGELLFVEPVRGLDNLFARPNGRNFYLLNNNDRLTIIPENKP
ncbi:hypothetical protein [Lewinella cohaerens]|uniref:hypothetical protein n=1 Tax=Lewinella cohaerens TaxID=70995 RepID=UPI0003702478|nr:hypothetical protein [Lewinella cohaerens]